MHLVLMSVLPWLVALLIAANPVAASLCDAWCAPVAAHPCGHDAPDGTPAVAGSTHDCAHGDVLVAGRSGTQAHDVLPADIDRDPEERRTLAIRTARPVVEYPPPLTAMLSSITPLRV